MTTLVRYEGEIVASVGRTRFYLAPGIEALPDGHPKLRVAVLMCVYALEVAQGQLPGPYSDDRALAHAKLRRIG